MNVEVISHTVRSTITCKSAWKASFCISSSFRLRATSSFSDSSQRIFIMR